MFTAKAQRAQRIFKVGDYQSPSSLRGELITKIMCQMRVIKLVLLIFALPVALAFAGPLRLAWDPPPNYWIAGYHVYRSDVPGGPYTRDKRLTTEPVTKCEYSDETAVPGKTYHYVVTTVGTDGKESAFSSELKATLANYDATPEPGALIARAARDLTVRSGDTVILTGNHRDPEGKNVTYQWSQTSGKSVSLSGSDRPEASFLAPIVTTKTDLIFDFTVTDSEGGKTSESIRVTVLPVSSYE
jgi:hypothetical protein